jgi:tetratricopeptide (TPR) repeat protein
MVHMLAESPAYRDAFPDFLKDNPAEGDPALQKAFGKGLKDLITEAQRYFARPVLAAHIERLPGRRPLMMIERDSGVELEAAELRADLLWQAGRQREAWRLFERLAAQQSRPELALVARAYLALQQSSPEEALPLFERAIAAGVGSPGLLLQYAILMRESKADETVVEQAFEKAAAAGSAEAAYLLGMRRSAAGRHAEALESLEAAAKAMPDRADVWHALAYARQRSGAIEGSRFAARQALLAAESPQELDMALALLESIDAAMAPQQGLTASSKPAVYAPPTWDNPKGDSLSEGLLRYVECEGTTARLSIESEGRLLVLSVLNPRKVVWRNAPGGNFELTCGPQAPRPVVVEYKRTTQEITAIEFR